MIGSSTDDFRGNVLWRHSSQCLSFKLVGRVLGRSYLLWYLAQKWIAPGWSFGLIRPKHYPRTGSISTFHLFSEKMMVGELLLVKSSWLQREWVGGDQHIREEKNLPFLMLNSPFVTFAQFSIGTFSNWFVKANHIKISKLCHICYKHFILCYYLHDHVRVTWRLNKELRSPFLFLRNSILIALSGNSLMQ